MISKPRSKNISPLKCSVCRADIIDFSNIYHKATILGLICNECNSRFSSQDVDMMINLFLAMEFVTKNGEVGGEETKLGLLMKAFYSETDADRKIAMKIKIETRWEMVDLDEAIDAIKKTIAEGDTAIINEIVLREMGITIDAVIKKIEEERDTIEKDILFKNHFKLKWPQFKSFDETIAAIKEAIAEGKVNKRFLKLFIKLDKGICPILDRQPSNKEMGEYMKELRKSRK